jgi:hypothetical protein
VQQSLREDPPELREPAPGAVHASRNDRTLAGSITRVLAVATAIGLFLGFVGAFGLGSLPLVRRCLLILPYSWIGSLLGFACFRLVLRSSWMAERSWVAAIVAGFLMTPPMCVVVWFASYLLSPPGLRIDQIPQMAAITVVMCVVMSLFANLMRSRTRILMVTAATGAPKFLERLPLKLRGAEVWAVEAEDHYLRLHTSKGQDLILMRLSDAVAELDGIEGAQVHRSWWVARDAIADARRGDGRATLTLKDGSEVPVSRTYARILRQRNWI